LVVFFSLGPKGTGVDSRRGNSIIAFYSHSLLLLQMKKEKAKFKVTTPRPEFKVGSCVARWKEGRNGNPYFDIYPHLKIRLERPEREMSL
jgi:hypothetical protein